MLAMAAQARAGNFTLAWGTAPYTWVAGSLGPATYTLTDQYGFQVQVRFSITQTNGAGLTGYPDDLTGFGTLRAIHMAWDPPASGSNIGGSPTTAVMEILNGTTAQTVDGLQFNVSDIDAVDNNVDPPSTDRCDHVTLTGNAGNPSLSAVTGSPTFLLGSGPGAGLSPSLASNQAQCNFRTSISVTSATSTGDDNGSLNAVFPNGTHTATVVYNESIRNVFGTTTTNAAARGVGMWSATAFTINNSISLDKKTTTTSYVAVGQVIPYSYVVTNNGPLPILSTQNIQIQDSKIGTFNCAAIPAAGIAVGGTHTCTANYTVTAADVLAAGGVTNTATAGVGTGAQSFATRLQSNADIVNVPNRVIDAVNNDFSLAPVSGATGGTTASVFANDTLGAAAFASTAVVASITANGGLTGASLNSNGTLTVPAGTTAGTYVLTYRICDATAPAQCDSATATVVVSASPVLAIAKSYVFVVDTGTPGRADRGDVIRYSYLVTNNGNVAINNVTVTDNHGGFGSFPTNPPGAILSDTAPLGDSSGTPGNATWAVLAPRDSVTFTADYTVEQADIDQLQ